MTGNARLVGVCWGWVNMSRHHQLMNLVAPAFTFCLRVDPQVHGYLSWDSSQGGDSSVSAALRFLLCIMNWWSAVQTLDERREGILPTTRQRAEVWPYCSPNKSPQILTDVKVHGRFVGCLLMEIRSVGTLLSRLPRTLHVLLPVSSKRCCCCCIPSGLISSH